VAVAVGVALVCAVGSGALVLVVVAVLVVMVVVVGVLRHDLQGSRGGGGRKHAERRLNMQSHEGRTASLP
jgi:hypothetical protein